MQVFIPRKDAQTTGDNNKNNNLTLKCKQDAN